MELVGILIGSYEAYDILQKYNIYSIDIACGHQFFLLFEMVYPTNCSESRVINQTFGRI